MKLFKPTWNKILAEICLFVGIITIAAVVGGSFWGPIGGITLFPWLIFSLLNPRFVPNDGKDILSIDVWFYSIYVVFTYLLICLFLAKRWKKPK
jgi:hypothetical protein